jgi:GntR family transcriptional repressor for pyruvate dehydrogenase complex
MSSEPIVNRRHRNLALGVVEGLADRIRSGRVAAGEKLPTEAAIMGEFGVSRTVVREAISRLQASGMVETRHGIGTFSLGAGDAPGFRITAEDIGTLQDIIAVLELRIGVETEAAALAAQRRTDANLRQMRLALDALAQSVEEGRDAVGADFQFHLEVARATQNPHFTEMMTTLGSTIIPRARLHHDPADAQAHLAYMRRINAEHENILDAIGAGDTEGARAAMRTHLANGRERRRRAQAALR